MKKLTFIALTLLFSLFVSNPVSAQENIKVHPTGTYQITESVIEVEGDTQHVKEKNGVEVIGNLKVTEKKFEGSIKDKVEKINLSLIGEKVMKDGNLIKYEGIVNGEEDFTFEAIVEKEPKNKFSKATVSVTKPEHNKTFIFDGKAPNTSEKTLIDGKEVTSPEAKTNENTFSLLADSYGDPRFVYASNGMRSQIVAPNTIGRGQSDYHTVNAVSRFDEVKDKWKEEGYISFYFNEVSDFDTYFYSNGNAVQWAAADPVADETDSYNLPVYVPYVGYQTVPVEVGKTWVDIGAQKIGLDLNEIENMPESNLGEEEGNKLGMRVEMDTSYNTSYGTQDLRTKTHMQFKSRAYKSMSVYMWTYEDTTHDYEYDVDVN
ncbi:hypothetical protein H0266_14640 [Halobacillus locisalis]|uniref:Uncharacterized protein n=1 Tax=Halobacillus locisalis TaxID=220753 RepID=A0A838CW42_9BACI|nr:hypothetical protein [Halobacillus locisalis]MBA2176131.1 hypothetical protein [Halobacillus locisalis]